MIKTILTETDYNDTQHKPIVFKKSISIRSRFPRKIDLTRQSKEVFQQQTINETHTDTLCNDEINKKILVKLQDLSDLITISQLKASSSVNDNIYNKLDTLNDDNMILLTKNIKLVNENIKKNTNCTAEINKKMSNLITNDIDQITFFRKIEKNNKKNQNDMEQLSNKLLDIQKICLIMSESILKIDVKLSQYDIDDESQEEEEAVEVESVEAVVEEVEEAVKLEEAVEAEEEVEVESVKVEVKSEEEAEESVKEAEEAEVEEESVKEAEEEAVDESVKEEDETESVVV
jgi:hypothetical protein